MSGTGTVLTIEDAAQTIKLFREVLIGAGYRHANAAGELVSQDDTTWVGTSYVYGEFSIHAWRRPRGHGEIGEVRNVLRVRASHRPDQVAALARRLARWAKHPPKNGIWPPKEMEAIR